MVGGCGSHPHRDSVTGRPTRPRPPAPSGASPSSQAGLRSRSAGGGRSRFGKPLPRTEPFGGRAVWGCNLYEIAMKLWVWARNRRSPATPRRGRGPPVASTAKAETLDQGSIPFDVGLGDIVEEPSALTDQQHQATPTVVVVLVLLEVLGQVRFAWSGSRPGPPENQCHPWSCRTRR